MLTDQDKSRYGVGRRCINCGEPMNEPDPCVIACKGCVSDVEAITVRPKNVSISSYIR